MMRPCVTVILACWLLVSGTVYAGDLSNVTETARLGDDLHLKTADGAHVLVDFMQEDLFRIWVGPDGDLTDEGSQAAPIVVPRDYEIVPLKIEDQGGYQLVTTGKAALRIYGKPLRFELYRADNETLLWRELKPLHLEAENSYQSLASHPQEHYFGGGQQNGSFEFKGRSLEISYSGGWEEGDRPSPAPFYMTNTGYGVLRNTWADGSYDFRSDDYITTTHAEHRFDAYYFVGDGLHRVLELYTQLTGRAPLLPRWAFEYGDADCYNDGDNIKKPGTVPEGWSDGPTGTTPDVVETVAAKYREHDMPGGWILPNDGYGCGYTDLPEVVSRLAEYGFRTGLWTENGVEQIAWEVGTAGTRVQKLDVAWTGQGYQFALDANMDAAQGILDNSDSRPFLWTVMGWAGIQRYAVTWTGDQSGSWDYIRWHVATLIGSGLSGQVYATGDVDGIFGGSPATFCRDLQWKCFTPVLMGMSGWSKAERKHPWWFDEPYRSINRDYLKLKMRLMPYTYTLAREAELTGAPIVRGLMWDHTDDPHAYDEAVKNQFFLGRDLLVAPVFRSEAASGGWREDVYLPAGRWIDYWNGTVTEAGSKGLWLDYPVTLEKLPVLVRAGAIIPMYPESLYDGQVASDVLTLDIYPQGPSTYTLYEDDGNTRAYQDGEFSEQVFSVKAPQDAAGDIAVTLGPVDGQFEGLWERRNYELWVHTRTAPTTVAVDGSKLPLRADHAAYEQSGSGWYYDADDRYGTLFAKTGGVNTREQHTVSIAIDSGAQLATTAAYPVKPPGDGSITADYLSVVMRPAEEPGHPLENAFDSDQDTWFRTVRDQSVKSGPHEFVLALGGRRQVDGFRIRPRNDKYWEYGQVRDYEIYLSDVNGQWGEPVTRGSLEQTQELQEVRFKPSAGRLLRFRILSTHDDGADPMVTNAAGDETGAAYDAFVQVKVSPTTISEFQLLEHPLPDTPRQKTYLSAVKWALVEGEVTLDHACGTQLSMKMNGLRFYQGLSVQGTGRVDYRLAGDWQLFRADAGLDDSGDEQSAVRFQVFGDGRLLYDSGVVRRPAVVKPELDIRGIEVLSLRTVPVSGTACANWANAHVVGFAGDKVGP